MLQSKKTTIIHHVWILEIVNAFSKNYGHGWEKRGKYHKMKTNLIIFLCLRDFISLRTRSPKGFYFGIDSTKICS